jgi:hypothetical protein
MHVPAIKTATQGTMEQIRWKSSYTFSLAGLAAELPAPWMDGHTFDS